MHLDQAYATLDAFVGAALLDRIESSGQPVRWQQHGLLRGYALALLRREGEYEPAAARHTAIYDEAMRQAREQQQFYRMQADYAQLQHAFAWAIENNLERAQSLIANCAELQTAFFALGRDNLRWCEAALAAAQQRGTPADSARAQVLLGNALSRVATLGDEDRGARLHAALAAYEKALRFRTPAAAPLDYAITQNNRGAVLQGLATLGEEDRGARLREALAAYEAALRFYTPEAAPLDYAMTQGNLLNLYQAMAGLPEENRRTRLAEALRVGLIAFSLFGQLQHSYYQQQAARQLQGLRSVCGADFDALWQTLDAGPVPEWLGRADDDAVLAAMQQLLEVFLGVADAETLIAFWQQVPLELEDTFIAVVEQQIAEAEQQGNAKLAEALQQRLDGVRQLQAMQQEQVAEEEQ